MEKILQCKEEIQLLFKLISKIADNHRRTPDFLCKIETIIQFLIKNKSSNISDYITNYEFNKWALFSILKKELLIPDQIFLENYLKKDKEYIYYIFI